MRIDEPTSILVFRNGSIGNTLVALPAIQALKKRYPGTKLTAVLDPVGSELLRHCEFIDLIITYDKRGSDKGVAAHFRLMRKLRAVQPSHALLLKRFFRNGLLAYLSGAKYRIGFKTNGKAPFLNRTILYDESIHIAQLNMNLLSLLGIQDKAESYSIPITDQDRNTARNALSNSTKSNKFVVVHYGGSTTSPDFFSIERMTELLRTLVSEGHEIVFIGAGTIEMSLSRSVVECLGCGTLLFDLPIRTMAAIIEKASCFIGFNSGPAHIAAGVRTPGVVIYRPDASAETEIRKWRPLFDKLYPVVPPEKDDTTHWSKFLENTRGKLFELLTDRTEQA